MSRKQLLKQLVLVGVGFGLAGTSLATPRQKEISQESSAPADGYFGSKSF